MSEVIFEETIAGQNVRITEDMLTEATRLYLLRQGAQRAKHSARAGKQSEEADNASLERMAMLRDGNVPQHGGGGPRLTNEEKAFRTVVETVATAKAGLQSKEARQIAMEKDLPALAKALLRKQGKGTGKDAVEAAVEKIEPQLREQADSLAAQWNAASNISL